MMDAAHEIEALRAALVAAEARARSAEAQIAHLKAAIARMRQDRFGASSERHKRLLDQMELELEDLETELAEDAPAEEILPDTPISTPRRNRGRQPLPAHLPRERVIIPAPRKLPVLRWRSPEQAG